MQSEHASRKEILETAKPTVYYLFVEAGIKAVKYLADAFKLYPQRPLHIRALFQPASVVYPESLF